MKPERWRTLSDLVENAFALSPEAQAAYLDQACPDPALRAEAQAMLAMDRLEDSVLDRGLAGASAEPKAGDRLGPYRLTRELGRGGMGVVFLAERADAAYEKEVAVKLLKAGWTDGSLARRFRAEVRILARLEHPNIARLYDAGTTTDGRPYLVMEYVDGAPITRFCRERGLDLRARLKLFIKVCAGVQEAHRNLTIHRDLKPGNILVNAAGEPKLLDFGIAKLLQEDEQPAETQWRPMTPAYASPEQLLGEPLTTASDVYALGALLYELLTDARPYPTDNPTAIPMQRLRERREPCKPSLVGPRRWGRRLAGDLDCVALKALRHEPRRRYDSAAQLAEDLQRFLQGFPVRARRGTAVYRLGKFARRHRAALTATAVLAVVVIGLQRANRLSLLEEQRQTDRALARAERVADLTADIFALSDPYRQGKEAGSVRALLDQAADRIRVDLREEPEVRARLLTTLGEAYANRGLYREASPLMREALAAVSQAFAPESAAVLAAECRLGEQLMNQGEYSQAEDVLRETLATANRVAAGDEPYLVETHNLLGRLAFLQGRHDESLALHREAWRLLASQPDRKALEADTLQDLARAYHQRIDYPSADRFYRRALALKRNLLGERHPEVGLLLLDYFALQKNRGDANAEASLNMAQEILAETLDSDHPLAAIGLVRLAQSATFQGRHDEAEALLTRALTIQESAWGSDHPRVGETLFWLGKTRSDANRLDGQVALFRRAIDLMEAGAPHSDRTARAYSGLGAALADTGRLAEAERCHRRAIAMRLRVLGPNHPATAYARANLAFFLSEQDRCDETVQTFRLALRSFRNGLGPDHLDQIPILLGLASALVEAGARQEAEALYWEAFDLIERRGAPAYRHRARQALSEHFRRMGALAQAGLVDALD